MHSVKFFSGLLMMLAIGALSFTNPITGTYSGKASVDISESTIAWNGYKVTGEHNGTITLKSGNLHFENGSLVGGNFEIDMATIVCNDLTGEYNTKLVNHLKSSDFFNVAEHPTASMKITKVIPYGTDGEYKVIGDLTIKETTKEIKFMTSVNKNANSFIATSKIVVDRSDYNVRYGSGSFFDNLGDKTIYDEFDLNINLVAKK